MKAARIIRLVTSDEKDRWNQIVNHPLQTWEWGQFRMAMGVDVVRLGVYEKNTLIEGWQLTFHRLPYLPFTIGYFPKGPIPDDQMLREFIVLGKKKYALFIQLEPDMPAEGLSEINRLRALQPAHHPLFTKYTFVLDLTKTEEELLSAMHSKTRYNIRLAQKRGVLVREDNSDGAFETYLKLSRQTTQRQGFYAHNERYHKTLWKILYKAGIAHLFTATLGDDVLAAWVMFVWKDTIYYPYGASSRLHKDAMAPNLLLWEIALWAKKKGLYYFDLWGAMGPPSVDGPDPNDPWYGFHRFKEGYTPNFVEFAGSFDLVIHPVLYKCYTAADSVRWLYLHATKRLTE